MYEDLAPSHNIEEFLRPLAVDISKLDNLSTRFSHKYSHLAAVSADQFLPAPIPEPLLRRDHNVQGRFLAIDIGGTNLRVGFIKLSEPFPDKLTEDMDVWTIPERQLERSWPIAAHLKVDKADELFAWIGSCLAEVIRDGINQYPDETPTTLPTGVAFSFPMTQDSLTEVSLMSMGKGFAITSKHDLAQQLYDGYESVRQSSLPKIRIAAIVNDAVSTFISLAYRFRNSTSRKAAVGLIVGTGANATIPLAFSRLSISKRPKQVETASNSTSLNDVNVIVNTEWSINGAVPPLLELGIVTAWDSVVSQSNETPGFQPFEYMTAGRYLGELGRVIAVHYFTLQHGIDKVTIPQRLSESYGLSTTFLGNLGRHSKKTLGTDLVQQLDDELPGHGFWTVERAEIIYKIALAIQVRAAGLTAAAIIGLLICAGEIPDLSPGGSWKREACDKELMIGFTGGCIVHFQSYLQDCQRYLDAIMKCKLGDQGKDMPKIVLTPCHDGGIMGAGILTGIVECKSKSSKSSKRFW